MSNLSLNLLQERELARLLDYEHATCSVGGELVYRCVFPYRPDDDLQRELIENGALAAKQDDKRGVVVTITSDGRSYFPELRRAEAERLREQRRDARLVALSALFAAACTVAGFLLGRFVA